MIIFCTEDFDFQKLVIYGFIKYLTTILLYIIIKTDKEITTQTTQRKEAEKMNAQTENKVKTKYFAEAYYMYQFLEENKKYKMVKYNFSFAYGYCLYFAEK